MYFCHDKIIISRLMQTLFKVKKIFILFLLLNFDFYVCVRECMYIYHEHGVAMRSKEHVGCPGTMFTGCAK